MEKQRVIQEYVPGKQVTMAHLIANPESDVSIKLGLEGVSDAIGIMTITPSEAAIIAVDIALKAANIQVGFLDRFSGSVVITGNIGAVESALHAVINGLVSILGFSGVGLTRS